ncbi:mechanosensitive ion channel family protein [Thermodesulfobacteriota bacterium]
MSYLKRMLPTSIMVFFLLVQVSAISAAFEGASERESNPSVSLSEDMGQAMMWEAAKVREDLGQRAQSLFEREPLGWDSETIQYAYATVLSLPSRLPGLWEQVRKEGRVLGLAGSLILLLFIATLLYSLLGQQRILRWVENKTLPLARRIPEKKYPLFQSGLKVAVSVLIPLLLVCLFMLVDALIAYRAAWFQLTGRLLWLWVAAVLILRLLKESLTRDLFSVTSRYGKKLYFWARFVMLYVVVVVAVVWAAEAFHMRADVLALLRTAISISVVFVLFQFFSRKTAFISLFPDLPYRKYQTFLQYLGKYYYQLMAVSFAGALLWSLGYGNLGRFLLTKIWFTLAAVLLIILLYGVLNRWLQGWSGRRDASDEAADMLIRSLRALLLYGTVVASLIVVMNLLGLLGPLQRLMSFPIFTLGETQVSIWVIFKAVLILLGVVFVSRLVQAYLDYKVYPALGIDPGLGYALNTFLKFVMFGIGLLISLEIMGINLRFLLVFAGAIGIGIGLGLQNMAANVISGFTIIFGGKIRKGDWIEVGSTLGTVTDIYLRATKVRTRDNIEYLIPNSDLISKTIINYSLSSPMIRIELPVGVSYGADPREVEKILLEIATKEPLVAKYRRPAVRFVEYGDSSINFELLIWMNVRDVPRRRVRSALYFSIFEAFREAGIEIPFPQRDIHVRSDIKAGE